MAHIDPDVFAAVGARYLGPARLTAAEHAEMFRMAQGFSCKEAAAAARLSPDTIRARRKRIYRKLGVESIRDLVAGLLAVSLGMLAGAERPGTRPPQEGPAPRAADPSTFLDATVRGSAAAGNMRPADAAAASGRSIHHP